MDSNNTASNTETLTQYASEVSDVEKNGPYTGTLFKVEGTSGISGYPSDGVADFNDATVAGPNGPDTFTPKATITAINSITLSVYNRSAPALLGPIDIYLVPDATSNIDPASPQSPNPHFFDSTNAPEGLGSGANSFGTPVLLGMVQWNASIPAFSQVQIPLINYSATAEQTLIGDLNGGTKFRVVATPENSTVYADWEGNTFNNGIFVAPQLSFGVTEASATAPFVVSSQIGDGTVQRSSIKSVSLTFNSGVNFSAASFSLYKQPLNANGTINTGLSPTDVSAGVSFAITGNTVTFSVIPGGLLDRTGATDAGLFTNGVYQLVLHGSNVTDATTSSAQLNGGADQAVNFNSNETTSGASHTSTFYSAM